jgi:phosphatidylinositol 3-kinase
MEPFSFAKSCDIDISVKIKIDTLDGFQEPILSSTLLEHPDLRHKGSNTSPHSELYVTAQIWALSKPWTVPVTTKYKIFKNARSWNEWLTLPTSYDNLPQDAQLAITVYDLSPAGGPRSILHRVPFGGTTIPLFDGESTLLTGRQRCKIHRNRAADGMSSTATPYKTTPTKARKDSKSVHEKASTEALEVERLELLLKQHEMGEIKEDEWLDPLTFGKIKRLRQRSLQNRVRAQHQSPPGSGEDPDNDGGLFYLYIELQRFDHPILFADHEYPAPNYRSMQSSSTLDIQLKPPPGISLGPGIDPNGNPFDDPVVGPLIRIYDPEVSHKENPAEVKHRRLQRSHRLGVIDRDMKPNASDREDLNVSFPLCSSTYLQVSSIHDILEWTNFSRRLISLTFFSESSPMALSTL